MDDSEIRRILKQWLKANATEKGVSIRIFFEKAIVNSIADVLAVTAEIAGLMCSTRSDPFALPWLQSS